MGTSKSIKKIQNYFWGTRIFAQWYWVSEKWAYCSDMKWINTVTLRFFFFGVLRTGSFFLSFFLWVSEIFVCADKIFDYHFVTCLPAIRTLFLYHPVRCFIFSFQSSLVFLNWWVFILFLLFVMLLLTLLHFIITKYLHVIRFRYLIVGFGGFN